MKTKLNRRSFLRHTALTTGEKWSSSTISKYQMMALDMAKGSYRSVPGKERSHSTLTLTLSEPEFKSIREDISVLRRKILEVANNAPAPDRVTGSRTGGSPRSTRLG